MYASFAGIKSYSKDFTVFNEKNSPVRVYEHIENGIQVSSCTRGKESGTTSGTYRSTKYVTPSTSRYYSSRQKNASSTGYAGIGSTQPVVIWETEPNDDGTVTVTGWHGNSRILNIPETIDGKKVTKIGKEAFYKCANLTVVSFSDRIEEIGNFAFYGCSSLKNVQLPSSLKNLGSASFGNCPYLESLYIPSSIERVSSTPSWPAGTPVYRGPFEDCQNLETVSFGSDINKIPSYLFEECIGLIQVEIPGTVTEIEKEAFYKCTNLVSVSFGKWVGSIDCAAYSGCTALSNVYYGGSEAEWNNINIELDNEPLTEANIHYNADIPDTPDTKPEPTLTPGPTNKPTPTPPVTHTPGPTSTPKFTGIKSGAYYYDAVIWAVKKGVTSGTGNNKFSPNASCTRGQIVTFLWRAAGSPDPVSSANPFSDVKPSDYFYKAVLWAVENNITSGIGGGRFGPGGACT